MAEFCKTPIQIVDNGILDVPSHVMLLHWSPLLLPNQLVPFLRLWRGFTIGVAYHHDYDGRLPWKSLCLLQVSFNDCTCLPWRSFCFFDEHILHLNSLQLQVFFEGNCLIIRILYFRHETSLAMWTFRLDGQGWAHSRDLLEMLSHTNKTRHQTREAFFFSEKCENLHDV